MYIDDLKLVQRVLDGEASAFEEFYEVYFPRIYRFCKLRVESTECCKDIVQQTLIDGMRALESYRGEASLHTWLCQICRNQIATWYKKSGAKHKLTDSFDSNPELVAAIESIPNDISGRQFDESFALHDIVVSSLDSLPVKYGRVLQLKYIEGQSVAEIAHVLETTEISVQSLLARARAAFKVVFNDLHQQHLAGYG